MVGLVTMDWETTLYLSHYVFAGLLFGVSYAHKGYALRQACRWSTLFYLTGLLLADIPEPPHWLVFVALDVTLALIVYQLRAPVGAACALLASAWLGAMNGLDVWPALFYDMYEPLALTLNLAQVYYLALLPRVRPRDRRWRDRLPLT